MTVSIIRIPSAPRKPRTPRDSRHYFDVTGTREEIDEFLVKEKSQHDPYDSMYGTPVEQPDGSWVMRGSSCYSCD